MKMSSPLETGRGARMVFGIALIGFVLALGVLEAVTSRVVSEELATFQDGSAPGWLAR